MLQNELNSCGLTEKNSIDNLLIKYQILNRRIDKTFKDFRLKNLNKTNDDYVALIKQTSSNLSSPFTVNDKHIDISDNRKYEIIEDIRNRINKKNKIFLLNQYRKPKLILINSFIIQEIINICKSYEYGNDYHNLNIELFLHEKNLFVDNSKLEFIEHNNLIRIFSNNLEYLNIHCYLKNLDKKDKVILKLFKKNSDCNNNIRQIIYEAFILNYIKKNYVEICPKLIGLVLLTLNPYYYEIGIVTNFIGNYDNLQIIPLRKLLLEDYNFLLNNIENLNKNRILINKKWINILINLSRKIYDLHNLFIRINKFNLNNILISSIDSLLVWFTSLKDAQIYSEVKEFMGFSQQLSVSDKSNFFHKDINQLCKLISDINLVLGLGLDNNLFAKYSSIRDIYQYLNKSLNLNECGTNNSISRLSMASVLVYPTEMELPGEEIKIEESNINCTEEVQKRKSDKEKNNEDEKGSNKWGIHLHRDEGSNTELRELTQFYKSLKQINRLSKEGEKDKSYWIKKIDNPLKNFKNSRNNLLGYKTFVKKISGKISFQDESLQEKFNNSNYTINLRDNNIKTL